MNLQDVIDSLEAIKRQHGGQLKVFIRHDEFAYGDIAAPHVIAGFQGIGAEGEPIVIIEDDSDDDDIDEEDDECSTG